MELFLRSDRLLWQELDSMLVKNALLQLFTPLPNGKILPDYQGINIVFKVALELLKRCHDDLVKFPFEELMHALEEMKQDREKAVAKPRKNMRSFGVWAVFI
ncbi:hypothetical protein YC2023_119737 [Brassica napus]